MDDLYDNHDLYPTINNNNINTYSNNNIKSKILYQHFSNHNHNSNNYNSNNNDDINNDDINNDLYHYQAIPNKSSVLNNLLNISPLIYKSKYNKSNSNNFITNSNRENNINNINYDNTKIIKNQLIKSSPIQYKTFNSNDKVEKCYNIEIQNRQTIKNRDDLAQSVSINFNNNTLNEIPKLIKPESINQNIPLSPIPPLIKCDSPKINNSNTINHVMDNNIILNNEKPIIESFALEPKVLIPKIINHTKRGTDAMKKHINRTLKLDKTSKIDIKIQNENAIHTYIVPKQSIMPMFKKIEKQSKVLNDIKILDSHASEKEKKSINSNPGLSEFNVKFLTKSNFSNSKITTNSNLSIKDLGDSLFHKSEVPASIMSPKNSLLILNNNSISKLQDNIPVLSKIKSLRYKLLVEVGSKLRTERLKFDIAILRTREKISSTKKQILNLITQKLIFQRNIAENYLYKLYAELVSLKWRRLVAINKMSRELLSKGNKEILLVRRPILIKVMFNNWQKYITIVKASNAACKVAYLAKIQLKSSIQKWKVESSYQKYLNYNLKLVINKSEWKSASKMIKLWFILSIISRSATIGLLISKYSHKLHTLFNNFNNMKAWSAYHRSQRAVLVEYINQKIIHSGSKDIAKNVLLRKYLSSKTAFNKKFLSQTFKNSVISSKKFLSISNQLACGLVKIYLKDFDVEREKFKLFDEILQLKGSKLLINFSNESLLDLIRIYRAQTATIQSNFIFDQNGIVNKIKFESFVPSPKIYRIPINEKTVSSLSQKVADLQLSKKFYHLLFKYYDFTISNNIVKLHIDLRLLSDYFRNLIGAFRERMMIYKYGYAKKRINLLRYFFRRFKNYSGYINRIIKKITPNLTARFSTRYYFYMLKKNVYISKLMRQNSLEMYEWNRDNRRILKWRDWTQLNNKYTKMWNFLKSKFTNHLSLKLFHHWKFLAIKRFKIRKVFIFAVSNWEKCLLISSNGTIGLHSVRFEKLTTYISQWQLFTKLLLSKKRTKSLSYSASLFYNIRNKRSNFYIWKVSLCFKRQCVRKMKFCLLKLHVYFMILSCKSEDLLKRFRLIKLKLIFQSMLRKFNLSKLKFQILNDSFDSESEIVPQIDVFSESLFNDYDKSLIKSTNSIQEADVVIKLLDDISITMLPSQKKLVDADSNLSTFNELISAHTNNSIPKPNENIKANNLKKRSKVSKELTNSNPVNKESKLLNSESISTELDTAQLNKYMASKDFSSRKINATNNHSYSLHTINDKHSNNKIGIARWTDTTNNHSYSLHTINDKHSNNKIGIARCTDTKVGQIKHSVSPSSASTFISSLNTVDKPMEIDELDEVAEKLIGKADHWRNNKLSKAAFKLNYLAKCRSQRRLINAPVFNGNEKFQLNWAIQSWRHFLSKLRHKNCLEKTAKLFQLQNIFRKLMKKSEQFK